jgi:hypothetical protein
MDTMKVCFPVVNTDDTLLSSDDKEHIVNCHHYFPMYIIHLTPVLEG